MLKNVVIWFIIQEKEILHILSDFFLQYCTENLPSGRRIFVFILTMKKTSSKLTFGFLLAITILNIQSLSGSNFFSPIETTDTVRENQVLYRGRIWRNLYRKIEGNQYFISEEFLPGAVSIEGTTFDGLYLKYDIFNDEILTTSNADIIIQLNKEMVDSFRIDYFNSIHHFAQIRKDSTSVITGYVDILYHGKISLIVKYMKKINPVSAFKEYDNFFQVHKIYIEQNELMLPVNSKKDIMKLFPEDKQKIKEYLRSNRLKVKKDIPESFVPLVAFCSSLEN